MSRTRTLPLALAAALLIAPGAGAQDEAQTATSQEHQLDAVQVQQLEQAGALDVTELPESRLQRTSEARRLLQQAAELETEGDLEAAVRTYGAVGSLADAGLDGEVEAHYALQLAGLMAQRVEPPPAPEAVAAPAGFAIPTADTLYRRAIAVGTPQQSALARNNLANLHLERSEAARAVELLREVDLSAVPEGQRFVYRFNTGRALEASGAGDEAFENYLRVLEEQPAFVPAAEAAWRAARAGGDGTGTVRKVTRLGEHLLDAGQLGTFDEVVWAALEETAAPEILYLLARRWSVRPPEGGAPDEATWERLQTATAGDERAAGLALSLRRAFSTRHFAAAARRGSDRLLELSDTFRDWRRVDGGAAMANLLVRLAEEDRDRGDAAAALGRTFVAWWLDRANTQAAVDCAAALRARPDLDPEGRIRDELIGDLFEVKGRAYAERDWRNILRLHLMLASIYESEERWGSSGRVDSAIFQLERALRAEEELRHLEEDFTPSPGLHRRLAEAYVAVGEPERAFGHYLRAARALADLERVDDADRLVRAAGTLDLPPDRQRYEQLAETAAAVRSQRLALEERREGPVG